MYNSPYPQDVPQLEPDDYPTPTPDNSPPTVFIVPGHYDTDSAETPRILRRIATHNRALTETRPSIAHRVLGKILEKAGVVFGKIMPSPQQRRARDEAQAERQAAIDYFERRTAENQRLREEYRQFQQSIAPTQPLSARSHPRVPTMPPVPEDEPHGPDAIRFPDEDAQ